MDPAPEPARPQSRLAERLAAMAARADAELAAPPEPAGPAPTDEEALANVQAAFPGAVVQEVIQRNG